MKKLILLLLFFSTSLNGQILKDIFKYSTVYSSYTESSPLFTPEQYFVTQDGDVVDITPESENDFVMSFGIRKIARMDYENIYCRNYAGLQKGSWHPGANISSNNP